VERGGTESKCNVSHTGLVGESLWICLLKGVNYAEALLLVMLAHPYHVVRLVMSSRRPMHETPESMSLAEMRRDTELAFSITDTAPDQEPRQAKANSSHFTVANVGASETAAVVRSVYAPTAVRMPATALCKPAQSHSLSVKSRSGKRFEANAASDDIVLFGSESKKFDVRANLSVKCRMRFGVQSTPEVRPPLQNRA